MKPNSRSPSSTPRGDGFVGSYIKVCSDSLADLSAWVTERVRSTIQPCGTCRPAVLEATVASVPARTSREERLRGGASAIGQVPAPAAAGHQAACREPALVPREGAVTEAEADQLAEACRPLPVRPWECEEHDYVTNVLLTVLDLQMNNVAVERSIRHYRDHRRNDIRSLEHLEDLSRTVSRRQGGEPAGCQIFVG